eukprot:TRINITY_DN90772_c0_g1_i1.p1 TRINITY_DN90772_c0_g1~~TRINITY_DN90772_c0_g1_i1.p1  ORF type:complete len:720 (-),score=138.16 TRINITY_DN90772_c0_g1_i1:13-2172(-)
MATVALKAALSAGVRQPASRSLGLRCRGLVSAGIHSQQEVEHASPFVADAGGNAATSSSSTARPKKGSKVQGNHKPTASVMREDFQKLPLQAELRRRLRFLGMQTPTEIQARALRPVLDAGDVLGVARKGTGKTLAFLVPIMERILMERWSVRDHCVVVAPTRNLAEQIFLAATRLRSGSVKIALVYGGGGQQVNASQLATLRRGAHVVIGTPGRLRELMEAEQLPAERVRALVLDEADELLTQGLGEDVQALLDGLGKEGERQTLFFSAAMPKWLQDDVDSFLRNPKILNLIGSRPTLVDEVSHQACEIVGGATRRARLIAWLLEQRLMPQDGDLASGDSDVRRCRRAIIFAASRAEVMLLGSHAMLRRRVLPLHGHMGQSECADAVDRFKSSSGYALVTTDLAARGLDIPRVPLVIHSAAPPSVEAYTHRLSHLVKASSPDRQAPESVLIYGAHHSSKLRDLARDLGQRFDELAAPSQEELRVAAVAYIARELEAAVTQYDADAFSEDAQTQLDVHGVRLLAAALVLLERRKRSENWASALSGRRRYTPLLFYDPYLERIQSRQAMMLAIVKALRRSGGDGNEEDEDVVPSKRRRGRKRAAEVVKARVGRIELTQKGYVADVPHEDVSKLLRDSWFREQGIAVMPIAQLPNILDEPTTEAKKGRSRGQSRKGLFSRGGRDSTASPQMQFLFPRGRRTPFGPITEGGNKAAQELKKTS